MDRKEKEKKKKKKGFRIFRNCNLNTRFELKRAKHDYSPCSHSSMSSEQSTPL